MASLANKFASAANTNALKKALESGTGSGAANKTASVAASTGTQKKSSAGGYTEKYTGGNAALDSALSKYGQDYQTARAKGDVQGMIDANNSANQLRNQYGYAAEHATDDIQKIGEMTGYFKPTVNTQTSTVTTPTYSDLLKEQQSAYDEIQKQQEKAKKAAVDQAVGSLNRQKEEVGQSYSDLFRQLYIDRRMAEKKLPQQMAAMGYTGGLTESSALGLQTDYTEALRQGEQQRISALADLDQAISDTELQGDISIAELAAQNAKDKLTSYASLVEAMQAQANADRQYAMQQEQFEYGKIQDHLAQENWLRTMTRQELLDQLERDDMDYSRKLAAAQYLFENSGDASGLRMLGYSDSQIAALQRQWAAAQSGSGGSTAKVDEYEPRLTYDQVMEQINAGNLAPQVLKDYEYWNGEPFTQEQAVTESELSENAARIRYQLSAIPGLTPENKVAMITDAFKNGRISEQDVAALLDYLGYTEG